MYEHPRIGHIWLVTVLTAAPGGLALFVLAESPVLSFPFGVGVFLMTVACSFGLVWVLLMWRYWAAMWDERFERRVYAENLTPYSYAMLLAARLSDEQARLIPALGYETVAATVPVAHAIGFVLMTASGAVPYEWIASFLRRCGKVKLYPVSRYKASTSEFQWAVAFTEWLVAERFAVPAAGNQPAMWMSEGAYEGVVRRMRLWELLSWGHAQGSAGNVN